MNDYSLTLNDYGIAGYDYYASASIQYLGLSIGAVNNVLTSIMSKDIMANLGDGFTNKAEFICSLKCFPYCVTDKVQGATESLSINIGNTSTTLSLYRSWGYVRAKIVVSKEFNFGYSISRFTQNEPYESVQVFLPYVGYVDLDMNEIRASKGILKVTLVIDSRSGNGTYAISRFDNEGKKFYNFYTTQTNFGFDIPIGANNTARQDQAMFNASLQGIVGIGKTIVGAVGGNPFMTSTGVGSIVSSAIGMSNAQQQQLIQRGSLGQYPSTFNNPHAIYFIVKKRKINDYDSFKSYYGKPLNQKKTLSTLKGITFIPNPKLEIDNITKEEFDLLNAKLVDGIIL